MTVVAERIAKLRALMAEKGIDAYVVPTGRFPSKRICEGEHFKARKYITGFSGSYGTAVISQTDEASGRMEGISSRQKMN